MKATKDQVRVRVEQVLTLLLGGREFWDIVQHARENKWGVGHRQIANYIRRAYERMHKHIERDRTRLINRHLAQRRSLYMKTVAAGDHRTALAVLRDEAELLDLYPKKTYAVRNLSDVALDDEIRTLLFEQGGEGEAVTPAAGETGQGAAAGQETPASGNQPGSLSG
jgi:hypothetical protein